MILNKNDMPREKMVKKGASELHDYELLAIMLGCGTKKENVIDLSIKLINEYGLPNLLKMNYQSLRKISGIKEAKATKLMATFELAKRVIEYENNKNLVSLKTPKEVYTYVKSDYLLINYEKITILFLNSKLKVIDKKSYDGDVTNINISIKKIIKLSLDLDAYGVILIHNHPSENVEPSIADIEATNILYKALLNINVILLDHLIISKKNFYSFNENNISLSNNI